MATKTQDGHYTGLVNLGNTCFLNACLQVLKETFELNTILIHNIQNNSNSNSKSSTINNNNNNQHSDMLITKEWLNLLTVMNTVSGVISPNRFVTQLQEFAKEKQRDIFTGFVQNDLPEFLLFVFECFHGSIKRNVTLRIQGDAHTPMDTMAIVCYKMLQTTYQKEYSDIMETFYGIYVSELLSMDEPSKVHTIKPELFFILDLPIPEMKEQRQRIHQPSSSHITLNQCFEEYTCLETLTGENAWYNETTNTKENVIKRISFFKLPRILVITLKRFDPYGRTKRHDFVQYPLEGLDLSSFVSGYNPGSYIYDLYGVCYHHGNVLGGHYTACVKHYQNGVWVHYNDVLTQFVHDDTRDSIVNADAYCLFYRKRG